MIQLGLIGYAVSHSLSPKIQNAALNACGLEGEYSLFPIEPDDKQGLKDLLGRVRSGEIRGLNVTIPHKQNVIEFLDELTPTAKATGAVNVIYTRDDKLIGDNTDAAGFLIDLNNFLGDKSESIDRQSALVLGAGGSSRAVVYALLNDGWKVNVAARRLEQAEKLANSLANHHLQIMELGNLQPLVSNISLLVNTTPLGMTPNIDSSPLPEDLSLPQHVAVYDLVYNPRETKLVREARQQGCHATTGLGMLIEQAALGFNMWTGNSVSSKILWNAVDN